MVVVTGGEWCDWYWRFWWLVVVVVGAGGHGVSALHRAVFSEP